MSVKVLLLSGVTTILAGILGIGLSGPIGSEAMLAGAGMLVLIGVGELVVAWATLAYRSWRKE